MANKSAARWTPADAERELAAWRDSGKSLTTYARERGVNVQRLHWWKHRLAIVRAEPEPAQTAERPTFAAAFIRSAPAPMTLRVADITLEMQEPAAVPAEWVAAFASAVSRR